MDVIGVPDVEHRKRIGLLVYSAQYDFKGGQIVKNDKINYIYSPTPARDKLLLYREEQRDFIFNKGDQYVLLDESKEINKRDKEISRDKQKMPLLNTQEVIPEPEIPLSGVGLFLYRVSEFENFIGIKLFAYDFTPHINTDID